MLSAKLDLNGLNWTGTREDVWFEFNLRAAPAATAKILAETYARDKSVAYPYAMALKLSGQLDKAIDVLEAFSKDPQMLRVMGDQWVLVLGALAGYLAKRGDTKRADRLFQGVEKHCDPGMRAWYFAARGLKEKMLSHLRSDPEALVLAKRDVEFDRYRNDPEFKRILSAKVR